MRLKLEINDADPGYVEEKIGAELYVHLRAAPAIIDYRRRAIDRALALHTDGDKEDECRQSGLGLLVLQRAMLAVEDLGGLLFALEHPSSFERLVSYKLRDISGLFARLFAQHGLTPELFRFPTKESIAVEPKLSEPQQQALLELVGITLVQIDARLALVRKFWDTFSDEAKKTMHGLPFAASRYVVDPPGAGMITRAVPMDQARPFAVPLTTRIDHGTRRVNTEVGTIDLRPANVTRFANAGRAACEASEVLVAGRLHGLETNHALAVPGRYRDRLDSAKQAVLAELFGS